MSTINKATKDINYSFQIALNSGNEGVKKWLDENFKNIAALKLSDVVIKDLSSTVVSAMAIELARTSQVYGEYGYWVWGLSDAQIKSLSLDAGLALFKAWLSGVWTDETYSPNEVVNATLARQFQNFSGDVIENIIQKDFGVAARYQWLLSAEQLNELSLNSLSRIFGTIAQRTDLTSGLSNETVNKMAILLEQQGQGLGQVNGKYGHWVWGLNEMQIKNLSKEGGLALFKAWLSHDWLDETYSPNVVVNATLAYQFHFFKANVLSAIIDSGFGMAARYQWLLSSDQVSSMSNSAIKAIGPTIIRKFHYLDLPEGLWDLLGVPNPGYRDRGPAWMVPADKPMVRDSSMDSLVQAMSGGNYQPSASDNFLKPNTLGSSSNQALVAVH
jgi:hypothetical protein